MLRKSQPAPDFRFVTFKAMPDLDPDDRLALAALARRGFRTTTAIWDDPNVDWSLAGICVIRSTWDYHLHVADFLEWADRVASVTTLLNPPGLVRWNAHKSYLLDLEQRGVPVVPSFLYEPGSSARLADYPLDSQRIVIKPAVGLATFGVKRFDLAIERSAAQSHLNALLERGAAIVQPYFASVESYGERALIYIDGMYSHAARKTAFQPLLPAGEAGETAVDALPGEIELGNKVMRTLQEPALYARVDLVRDDHDKPHLLELELIEPSLFLGMHPAAADTFADALARIAEMPSA
jgi:hypothetical protein